MDGRRVSLLDESVNVVLCLFSTVRRNNPPAPWSMGGRRVSMLDNRSILNSIRMSLNEALQEQEMENSKLLISKHEHLLSLTDYRPPNNENNLLNQNMT